MSACGHRAAHERTWSDLFPALISSSDHL